MNNFIYTALSIWPIILGVVALGIAFVMLDNPYDSDV